MKILLIHLDNKFNLCPPAINVLENLLEHGHQVNLIGYNLSELNSEIKSNNKLVCFDLGKRVDPNNEIVKYYHRFKTRTIVRSYVKEIIREHDIVWTTSEITVRELGPVLNLSNRHIMQLMELSEFVPKFGGYKLFKFNIKKYAQSAYKVVVPEVNRAYITKTWWELSTLPSILPNKPYRIKNSGELSKDASRILEKVKNEKRKIILYQGGFTADRKFDLFAEAIRQLNNEYCLYLMGPDNQYRESICEKYPEIEYLGSLIPPEHLEVAAFSHIGILTYIPVNDGFHSSLNAQYCAPNKTFEYALKQLPMIGTDVMGLQEIFKEFNIGVCLKNESSEAVIEAIACIENNYDNMKKQCIEYYESVDLGKLLNKIIE